MPTVSSRMTVANRVATVIATGQYLREVFLLSEESISQENKFLVHGFSLCVKCFIPCSPRRVARHFFRKTPSHRGPPK